MGFLFGGGGGGGGSAPRPVPQVAAPATSSAERERRRRIGRAALVRSEQRDVLGLTTGRNVLTAV